MLTRLVKMEFNPEHEKEFLSLFDEIKATIQQFPGCIKLQLLRDKELSHVYYTLSHWENQESLDHYRSSQFFREVWPKAKRCFSQKAQAISLIEV